MAANDELISKEEPFSNGQQSKLWSETVVAKSELARKYNAEKMLDINNFAHSLNTVQSLRANFASKKLSRYLRQLDPAFERLLAFSKAISAFVQADPTVAGLVWGGILVVLEASALSSAQRVDLLILMDFESQCGRRLSSVLGRITVMLETMTAAMPRFETYIELYSDSMALQSSMRSIFSSYIDFCILAFHFFRRNPLYHFFNLSWSKMESLFNSAIGSITAHTHEFEAQARLEHHIAAKQHHAKVENALPFFSENSHGLTQCFSLPFKRNDKFFGREDMLAEIDQNLKIAGRQNSCAICGVAGLGKTQLAIEYCYRHSPRVNGYKYIFWIGAQYEETLIDGFADIARNLHLVRNTSKDTLHVDLTFRWLCEHTGWLLVFDNVNDPRSLDRFWPACDHGAIIVTSQLSSVEHGTTSALQLQSFNTGDGSTLLLKYSGRTPENTERGRKLIAEAEGISKEVDGLPLLLVGLAGYITQSRISLQDVHLILSQPLRGDARRMLKNEATNSSTHQYGKPVRMVYDLALRALSEVARDHLDVLAMFSPDSVCETMLSDKLEDQRHASFGSFKRHQFIDDVRLPLVKRNLITLLSGGDKEDQIKYCMHRSLQRILLDDLDADPEKRENIFECAVAVLRNHIPRPCPYMVPQPRQWPLYESIMPHIINIHHVFTASEPPLRGTLQFAELLCSAGAYLYEKGFGKLGLPILDTAECICAQHTDLPEHIIHLNLGKLSKPLHDTTPASISTPSLASLEANILAYAAGIHWVTGAISTRKQAREWTQRIVDLRESHIHNIAAEKITVSDLLLLANCYNDFAVQLFDEVEYCQAEVWLLKSQKIKEKLRSQGYVVPQFEFAESLKGFSLVRLAQGRQHEAIELTNEAVLRISEEEGPESVSAQYFKFWSAVVKHNAGHIEEAIQIHQSVFEARVKLLGELSHDTLHSSFALGQLRYLLGDNQSARHSLNFCIKNANSTQWPIECTLRAKYQLSLVLKSMNAQAKADALANESIDGRDALLQEHCHSFKPGPAPENQMKLFDSLVNHLAGRSTMGAFNTLPMDWIFV